MKVDLNAKSKYFTLKEMIKSETADKLGIDNTPNEVAFFNLRETMSFLDIIRQLWGGPIYVNSGYRCKELNDAIKGSETSQHMKGQAADITVGSPVENKKLFDMIIAHKDIIAFDQLIDESKYAWIHISHKFNTEANKKQVLHLK